MITTTYYPGTTIIKHQASGRYRVRARRWLAALVAADLSQGIALVLAGVVALGTWPVVSHAAVTTSAAASVAQVTSMTGTRNEGVTRVVVLPEPPSWVAPLAGVLRVNGDCKTGGSGGHWLAQRNGHLHRGIDLYRQLGTPILAVHSGVVTFVGYEAVGAGWYLKLYHGRFDGRPVYSTYMHMAARPLLQVGQKVTGGQMIGQVGHSGTAHDHLHFQAHVGGATNTYTTNPSTFLRAHGVEVEGC